MPSTGRADIIVLRRSSKRDILHLIICNSLSLLIALLISPACSIIKDEADEL